MSDQKTGKQLITTIDDFSQPESENLMKLDIACGQTKKEGFIGIDIDDHADIVHDLNVFPWPLKDSSVYEAYISHYVEHVVDLKSFMQELYRIMIPMGSVTIIGPYWTSVRAWQDFTHVRALTEHTFSYFDQTWLKTQKLDHYNIKADFECLNLRYYFAPEWEPRAEEAKMWAATHYLNVVMDMMWLLRAHKPMRA